MMPDDWCTGSNRHQGETHLGVEDTFSTRKSGRGGGLTEESTLREA